MDQSELEKYKQTNKQMWNEFANIHANSEFYGVTEFKKGINKLNPLEISEVGEVKGKSLLHLQCHFGLDTLSWARLGAKVTGMDFSDEGIRLARSLADELKIPSDFICCDLYELPKKLHEQFDIVFTSYGVLTWLPDIQKWAQVAASFVKPGGFFYIAEIHPFALCFDDETNSLQYRYPYFDKSVLSFDIKGTYAVPDTDVSVTRDYEWNHTLGEIITSLINAGLRIEFVHEHPFTVYQQLPFLVEKENGIFTFPNGEQPIPLLFSIKTTKPG